MPERSLLVLFFAVVWRLVCNGDDHGSSVVTSQADFRFGGEQTVRLVYVAEASQALKGSNPVRFELDHFPSDPSLADDASWYRLHASTRLGDTFTVFLQSVGYPLNDLRLAQRQVLRYLVQSNKDSAREYRQLRDGGAVLPSTGIWPFLLPRKMEGDRSPEGYPQRVTLLGNTYALMEVRDDLAPMKVPQARIIRLTPDFLLGLPHNTKQENPQRRFDTSDYKLISMERSDFDAMIDAGMTCLNVSKEQIAWVEDAPVFYWGPGLGELPIPVSLYQSAYLGPALYYDEPAVHARDQVLRPRLEKDETFRKQITPRIAYDAFVEVFRHTIEGGVPWRLIQQLQSREDFSVGHMHFPQSNLYTWETMISTGLHQLSQHPLTPSAIVFEPPGRLGTRRTLPEINMTYECQFSPDDPRALTSLLYGFLRGAARQTGKTWGMSVYGAVDRADTFWYQTHAYDSGATHFFFWDTYQLACVPFPEALAMARNLRAHADAHPHRDLARLREAAEVAIIFPVGYNLGHVFLGKGPLWGVEELNLERHNTFGLRYREVMQRVMTEVERCVKSGVSFDLLWHSPQLDLTGYRETVRIAENGRISTSGRGSITVVRKEARESFRPSGESPKLEVKVTPGREGQGNRIYHVSAFIEETDAPVYYTMGTDPEGVYQNVLVLWELYGPGEENYRYFRPDNLHPDAARDGNRLTVKGTFSVSQTGHYRLRTATVDTVGRTTIEWVNFSVD